MSVSLCVAYVERGSFAFGIVHWEHVVNKKM